MANDYDPQGNKYDYPEYVDPGIQPYLDLLEGLLGQTYDVTAPNVMGMLPWGRGQMQDWFTKMFTGRRGKRIGEEFKTAATEKLNIFAPRELERRKGAVIGGGGRGSSEMARMKAEARSQYAGALTDIDLAALELEEKVRAEDFARGMAGAGSLVDIARGDFQNAMQSAMLAMQATGQEADIIGMLVQMGMSEAQAKMLWDQWRYQIEHGGAEFGSGFEPYIGAGASYITGY